MPKAASEIESRLRALRERPEAVTDEDLRALAEALRLCSREEGNALASDYAELADGADLQQDLVEALADLPVLPTNPTIAPLLEIFEQDAQFYEARHALLAMTVPRVSSARQDPPELGTVQIEVLKLLAASEAIWRSDMTLPDLLAERGLPRTRDALRRMLDG